ncbi:MAG TPA: DEAD/DEAH box helicase [Frankiaceae bacterium]|nr:DEAD/DEAH box helicase [Frankiaceae bacterium]
MTFDQLLARADDEALQELLGPPTVRLLNLLDPTLSRPAKLRELLSSFRPPDELLRDARARQTLFDLLPRSAARSLCDALELPGADPYAALRGLRVTKGSRREGLLFGELGVVAWEPEPIGSDAPVTGVDVGYGLFDHQRDAARRAQALLDVAPNRVMLHMPTGSGKTRTAMHLVARELRRREPCVVTWLAYSEELCEQAATEFSHAWRSLGDRPVDIYRFWGNRDIAINEISDGLVVAGLAKTYQRGKRSFDFLLRLSDRASLVVIDEAHQAVAESYRFVLEVLVDRNPGSRLLGLSATPGRTWDELDADRELAAFFGRKKVTLEVEGYSSPVDYLVAEGYLAKPTFETLTHAGAPVDVKKLAASLDIPEEVLEALAADEQRNLMILVRVEQLAREHSRIIVFAATVSHARVLATALRARGVEASTVTGTTPPGERARTIARYKGTSTDPIVLVNYGVLTTGFDAPQTSAAVIARPTKSLVLYSQMVGRATRGPRAGGNAEAQVVTVIDTSLPGFGAIPEAFHNWEDVW